MYAAALLVLLLVLGCTWKTSHRLARIPAVGYDGWMTSWVTAIHWAFGGAPELVTQGYAQYKSHFFRVASLDSWQVFASGHLVQELRALPDDVASFLVAADDFMQSEFTHRKRMIDNPFHVPLVQKQLTKRLPELCPIMRDEAAYALHTEIPDSDTWIQVPALATVQRVVARISSRVLVGEELARNPTYLKVALGFTLDVVIRARIINSFPSSLKRIAGRVSLLVPSTIEKALCLLEPIIAARQTECQLSAEDTHSQLAVDSTRDMMAWLIDAAPADDCSTKTIATMMMNLNLASIYSTSMLVTQILYNLATWPEYIEPLRAEIAGAVERRGWSKHALDEMTRLDSFVKETLRLNGTAAYSGMRKILRPTTFSDGTTLEPGTFVATASLPTHHDASLYPEPLKFSGFRFHDMREAQPNRAAQQSVVAANDDFLVFGLGRHVWYPGRFFATMQVKIIVAHVLLAYDIASNGGDRPKDKWIGESCLPNPTAMLRVRSLKTAT